MPIQISLSTLDVYRSVAFKGDRVPIYYFSSVPPSITEEGNGTFIVTTIGVPESTTLYWRINHITTVSGDFTADSGSFVINSSRIGSFTVSATLQALVEGTESFSVIVSLTPGGPAVATSSVVSLNDLIVPTITDLFSAEYYQGTSSSLTITNGINLLDYGGAVWFKQRDNVSHHVWFDTELSQVFLNERRFLRLNEGFTRVNTTFPTDVLTFNNNGYSLAQSLGGGATEDPNVSGDYYHSWVLRKESKFFDIVPYDGNGSSNRQIAHNLQSAPGLMFITERYTDSTAQTPVNGLPLWHRSFPLGIFDGAPGNATGNNYYLQLSDTTAALTATTVWSNTAPTSTDFTVGTNALVNANGRKYIAYLFGHNEAVFGKTSGTGRTHITFCGHYVGGGTSGQQIDCGFTSGAQFLIIREVKTNTNTLSSDPWYFFEKSERGLGGFTNDYYLVDSSSALTSLNDAFSYYAPGFAINTGGSQFYKSGYTYIFFAIGE